MRPGEGRSTFLFFLHGFLLLFSYLIVKALREAFILTEFSAEVRAYGVAVIALVLMFVVPAYGAVRRRLDGARLLQAVTLFFALNMLGFAAAAYFGISTSFTFFVWVSIFGVMIIAQFWAFAADTFNLKSGQRLFPVIMMGANLGALAGAKFAAVAVDALQPVGLMVVATARARRDAARRQSRPRGGAGGIARAVAGARRQAAPKLLGGIELVLRDRYLLAGRALRRAAELDQHDRRVRARGLGARAMPTRSVAASAGAIDQGRAHHRFLRRFPVLGDAGRSPDPAAAGRAHLSLGRRAGALLVHADRRCARLRPDRLFVPIFSDHPRWSRSVRTASITR